MSETQFPVAPAINEHFVDGNRLWVYDGGKWNLWGNLQYVPVQGEKGSDGAVGPDGGDGIMGPRGKKGDSGEKGDRGEQGPDGLPGPGLAIHIVASSSDKLFKQVLADGVKDTDGSLISPGDELYKYKDYVPTVGDAASLSADDPGWNSTSGDPTKPPHPMSSLFIWTEAQEWIWTGVVGGARGEKGEPGLTGKDGLTGLTGQNGKNGLNGAHGGANAQVIPYVPASGPPGRLYLHEKNMTLYITTSESEA